MQAPKEELRRLADAVARGDASISDISYHIEPGRMRYGGRGPVGVVAGGSERTTKITVMESATAPTFVPGDGDAMLGRLLEWLADDPVARARAAAAAFRLDGARAVFAMMKGGK